MGGILRYVGGAAGNDGWRASLDALHYTAYLGPANAVAAGRIPLVDVFCQYGQSYLIYLLALEWLPWTYGAAALVTFIRSAT